MTTVSTITVCETCRQPQLRDAKEGAPCGEALLAEMHAAANDVAAVNVRAVACLMGCEHGCNIAISAEGKLTYVLGGFEPTADAAAAVVEYAAGHAASETGAVPFRQWPQGVKGHFKARVPPL
ncbi:MAG: DUF1636 family protein [Pikeienuella sp.]